MFGNILDRVRTEAPLIHSITNYVTANDCANILLACGALAIMADDPSEAAEITAHCCGLSLNLGTPNPRKAEAMLLAGRRANELKRPVVFDPVGVGASAFRMEIAEKLLHEVHFAAIRGNMSELRTLFAAGENTQGVEANGADIITEAGLDRAVSFAKRAAAQSGAVIAISGAIDIVADADRAYCIRSGHPLMRKVTGTGCQLTTLLAAFVAANPETPLEAAAAAVCTMGLCGEKAYARMTDDDGNATYRNYIIDAVSRLSGDELRQGANYEVRT